jgi:3-dehydroquinate synthetase
VNFFQVPTTLLAMVDSSVGGKTGVNLPEGKDLVGCFYQPRLVLADLDALATLPRRELAAGMAEVIKYGVIADAALFLQVASGRPRQWGATVKRCVEIKAEVVGSDERETTGRRAALNFGHTLGHAVEQAAGYGELLHGEAVAIGMRAAAHLSRMKVGLSSKEVEAIESAIVANELPLQAKGLDPERIKRAMAQDKKVKAGQIRWVLTPRIGETVLVNDVTEAEVNTLIDLSLL